MNISICYWFIGIIILIVGAMLDSKELLAFGIGTGALPAILGLSNALVLNAKKPIKPVALGVVTIVFYLLLAISATFFIYALLSFLIAVLILWMDIKIGLISKERLAYYFNAESKK